jgi:16S rRNA processing protein RimM
MSPAQEGSSGNGSSKSVGHQDNILVGKIASPFGVRGWTKVVSFTEPGTGLLEYSGWSLRLGGKTKTVQVEQGREHGKFLVVKFRDIDDRDQVALFTNAEIEVSRDQFPEAEAGSYYWADLIGLRVITVKGTDLGIVESLFETGANDVMVVQGDRERLVPWIMPDVVTVVDLEAGRLTVDWDPDF